MKNKEKLFKDKADLEGDVLVNQKSIQKVAAGNNKKWKIMTGVFGGIAAAGVTAAIVAPIVVSKNQSKPTPEPVIKTYEAQITENENIKVTAPKFELNKNFIFTYEISESNLKVSKKESSITIGNAIYKLTDLIIDEAQSTIIIPADKMISEHVTITLKTEVIEYWNVSFEVGTDEEGKTGGYIEGLESIMVPAGINWDKIIKPLTVPDEGYYFAGWWITDSTGEEKLLSGANTINKNFKVKGYFAKLGNLELAKCASVYCKEESKITITSTNTSDKDISYTTDGTNWTSIDFESEESQEITFPKGTTIYFKGINNGLFSDFDSRINIKITGDVKLGGQITGLCNGGGQAQPAERNNAAIGVYGEYTMLFEGSTGITEIDENFLNVEEITPAIFAGLFKDCTGLKSIPAKLLQAKTLESNCYSGMFQGCTGLTEIPEGFLPATRLSFSCYGPLYMINADKDDYDKKYAEIYVADKQQSYTTGYLRLKGMFSGCTGLTHVDNKIMPENVKIESGSMGFMFAECDNLETINDSIISNNDIGEYGYMGLFANCFKLTKSPEFKLNSSINVGNKALAIMFLNCNSLKSIPGLETIFDNAALLDWNEDSVFEMFYRGYNVELWTADTRPAEAVKIGTMTKDTGYYFYLAFGGNRLNNQIINEYDERFEPESPVDIYISQTPSHSLINIQTDVDSKEITMGDLNPRIWRYYNETDIDYSDLNLHFSISEKSWINNFYNNGKVPEIKVTITNGDKTLIDGTDGSISPEEYDYIVDNGEHESLIDTMLENSFNIIIKPSSIVNRDQPINVKIEVTWFDIE